MATEVMNQRRRIEVQAAALLVLALVMVWMTGANATRRKAKLQKVEWNYCDPEAARTSNITAVGMHPYPPRAGDKVKLLVAASAADAAAHAATAQIKPCASSLLSTRPQEATCVPLVHFVQLLRHLVGSHAVFWVPVPRALQQTFKVWRKGCGYLRAFIVDTYAPQSLLPCSCAQDLAASLDPARLPLVKCRGLAHGDVHSDGPRPPCGPLGSGGWRACARRSSPCI